MSNDEKVAQEEGNERSMTPIVERNIKALVTRRIKEEQDKPVQERIADTVTAFTGNIAFVYTHAAIFGLWIAWNVGWLKLKPFDPNFTGLSLLTAIEAIFLATFVLMNQKSLDAQADKRADLDLQISLLSEHEITRLISLVKAIANKLQVEEASNPEIDELAADITPEKVMDTMESHKASVLKKGMMKGTE